MNPSLCRLDLLTSDKIRFKKGTVCDYSTEPRPLYAFAYMLEGCADFIEDDRTSRIRPGDVIFTPQDSRYVSRWHEDSSILSIHFSYASTVQAFAGRHYFVQRLDGSAHRETFEAVHRLIRTPDADLSVLGHFFLLTDSLLSSASYVDLPPIDERIKKAVEFIDGGGMPESVDELAAMCSLSTSYFYSLFKSIMGTTPIEYKNLAALRRAKQMMLSTPSLSIEEVSEQAGFASSSYFRRVFFEHTAITPREYKKIARRTL